MVNYLLFYFPLSTVIIITFLLPVSDNSPPLSGTIASPLSLEDGSAIKQWKYGCSQLNPSCSKTAI
jgi:hypothetical protein